MKENYRGTGKSKEECQAAVDIAIERFKREHPGKSVPIALVQWVENIADKADCEMVRSRLDIQDIQHINTLTTHKGDTL